MSNVQVDGMAELIAEYMSNYTQDVTDGVKKVVDTVGKEVNEEIKKHITFKQPTGKYVRAFRIKTSFEDRYNKRNTWHVANGQHRLAHLLEKGHALRNGGRTESFEHIKYGEELAQKRMVELTKEAVENAGH
ncbi:HK97 gp10 family phage protein [Clostridium botulinum]|uniref:HK97 gp10 family phage protein n=1 Tax=Clostridium botulinum TaxID=1491 RepID=UPI003EFAE94B